MDRPGNYLLTQGAFLLAQREKIRISKRIYLYCYPHKWTLSVIIAKK